jgi:D-threo-aldose 1-dehydrogenase
MNWTEPLTRLIHERDFDCMLVAGRYTLLEQDSLDDLVPAATERHVSIIAGGVFNSGLLIDPRPDSTYNYEPAPPEIVERATRLRDACAAFDVPLRAAAIQFPLFQPAVAAIIVGARTPAEVEDCVEMLGLPIPPDLWSSLKEKGLIRDDAPTPE